MTAMLRKWKRKRKRRWSRAGTGLLPSLE